MAGEIPISWSHKFSCHQHFVTLVLPVYFKFCYCYLLLLGHWVVSDSLWPHELLAHQDSLFFTISQSLLEFMSIELVIPSNHLNLCHPLPLLPQSFPASGPFPVSQLFTLGGQSIGVSPSTSILPVNIQGWFPLGLTGLISLLSKGLSRVFSSTTIQKHQFFGAQPSLLLLL